MRIKSSQLLTEFHVTITGTEPWLDSIYNDFKNSESADDPALIKGDINLTPKDKGIIRVTGSVHFTPKVGCSRCDKSIPWPLQVSIDTEVFPENGEPLPRDLNLKQEDMDHYNFDHDELDLEAIINDALQTAIPNQFLAESEDGKSCKICKIDLSGNKVCSTGNAETTSPFAALKGLKFDN